MLTWRSMRQLGATALVVFVVALPASAGPITVSSFFEQACTLAERGAAASCSPIESVSVSVGPDLVVVGAGAFTTFLPDNHFFRGGHTSQVDIHDTDASGDSNGFGQAFTELSFNVHLFTPHDYILTYQLTELPHGDEAVTRLSFAGQGFFPGGESPAEGTLGTGDYSFALTTLVSRDDLVSGGAFALFTLTFTEPVSPPPGPVPEPSSVVLLACGLVGLAARRAQRPGTPS